MDVLAIILACSLYPDDAFVRVLVDVQSSGNPYFVGDLATLKTNDTLTSPEAALRFAEDLERRGGRPAVGFLGIPMSWADRYGRAPIELFDRCTNVAVATAAFAEYHARCEPRRPWIPHGRSTVGHTRRTRRHLDWAASRSGLLARFAQDLGLQATPAVILNREAASTNQPSRDEFDPSPQRSDILMDGPEGAPGETTRRPRAPLFMHLPARVPGSR